MSEKELPLCIECERIRGGLEESREEIDALKPDFVEAQNHWLDLDRELKAHQKTEHGEDDPWLLHLLAEKRGQLNFLAEGAAA